MDIRYLQSQKINLTKEYIKKRSFFHREKLVPIIENIVLILVFNCYRKK